MNTPNENRPENRPGDQTDGGSVPLARDPGPRDPGPGLPPVDPECGITECPPFRPDTVSLGPFDREPFALQDITFRMPGGGLRPPTDNRRCLEEWLFGALDAAGVRVGAFDRLQVHLIATDGWGPVQAVAGWVTRARHADPPPDPPPDPAPPDPPPGFWHC